MLYRIRRYEAVPEQLAAFHEFFDTHLLPVQLRHGARLVGRWETDEHEVLAIWEYDDEAAYRRIASAVAADPATAVARQERDALGVLFTTRTETFAHSALA